ncbi:TraB/GumN family protein [Sphingomonas pruni]|uniref:TraB/GumN family protein n=1 Tax=Sphingomonas pruni TaxID=40683 RepID=UPI0008317063|nr:TraB/GumN family protein [Sphingomonas pruni]
MKFFRRLIAAPAILLAPPVTAQSAPAPMAAPVATASVSTTNADPALWVVKDKDTTIYLFGTIHVLKPGLSWFDDGVKKAFDSSDALVLEMVQPDQATMQNIVLSKAYSLSGPTLTERLPEADRGNYLKAMNSLGIPPAAFDRAQPWFAATNLSLLPLMKLGYDPKSGPETVLTEAAATEKKAIEGLETPEQQIGYLAGLPEKVQMAFLESTLKDLPKTEETMNGMVAAWSRGDPDALAKFMNDGLDDSPELAKTLLFDRNARWAQWIKARLDKPGTVFVAVGAGHLAGKQSVIDQLKTLKIKAKRVAY